MFLATFLHKLVVLISPLKSLIADRTLKSCDRQSRTAVTPLNQNLRAAALTEVMGSQSSRRAQRQERKTCPEGSARGAQHNRDAMNEQIASVSTISKPNWILSP